MAILESVKELASKLGAETNGRDITDQLNKINKHLDEAALSGRDIAEAVKTYSKNASGGGGGGETFEVDFTANFETGEITANKTYAQALTAIQNNDIINFTINTPIPYIYGGCFICSNSVTEKDDMYFILTPNTPSVMDEDGIIIHNEAIIWTETGISMRSYDYNS